jgi:hypothetical protein
MVIALEGFLSAMIRQLGDVGGDPPRLIAGEQLGRVASAGVILAIDEGQRLAVVIADDETRRSLLDRQGRREAAGGHATATVCAFGPLESKVLAQGLPTLLGLHRAIRRDRRR